MNRVLAIAWREFAATVLTWSFVLSVLAVPVLTLGGMGAVAIIQASSLNDARTPKPVLVVGQAQDPWVEAMRAEREQEDSEVRPVATEQEALELLEAGQARGVVVPGSGSAGADGAATLHVRPGAVVQRVKLVNWVEHATGRVHTEAAGFDVEQVRELLDGEEPRIVVLGEEELDGEEATLRDALGLSVGLSGEMFLFLGVFVSAQYLLQNTVEERSSKVIELLLSAVSPMQLMAGKLIGLGAVGLLMTGIYAGTGLVALVTMTEGAWIGGLHLGLFGVFYLIAYLQMGSVFAAIGSAVNELREAQSLMTPAVLLMTLPFLCLPPIIESPDGNLAVALSLVPPLAPYVMVFRVLLPDPVPAWQILAALVLGTAWAGLMLWASARVFRVGVLMRGKAPSLRELGRWLLEA